MIIALAVAGVAVAVAIIAVPVMNSKRVLNGAYVKLGIEIITIIATGIITGIINTLSNMTTRLTGGHDNSLLLHLLLKRSGLTISSRFTISGSFKSIQ